MKIVINGKIEECRNNISIDEWVKEKGYCKDRIAIEVNEEIIPKLQYSEYRLVENDKLEVVSFVGGG